VTDACHSQQKLSRPFDEYALRWTSRLHPRRKLADGSFASAHYRGNLTKNLSAEQRLSCYTSDTGKPLGMVQILSSDQLLSSRGGALFWSGKQEGMSR
jgi:hypothetical protein